MEPILKANSKKGEEFVKEYFKFVENRKKDEQEWINRLREQGVKACHPNDGWVDRENNKIQFVYPLFKDEIIVGDKVMIGSVYDKKNHRLVKIIKIEKSILDSIYYHFKDFKTSDI